jgi:hypothetical protein
VLQFSRWLRLDSGSEAGLEKVPASGSEAQKLPPKQPAAGWTLPLWHRQDLLRGTAQDTTQPSRIVHNNSNLRNCRWGHWPKITFLCVLKSPTCHRKGQLSIWSLSMHLQGLSADRLAAVDTCSEYQRQPFLHVRSLGRPARPPCELKEAAVLGWLGLCSELAV